MSPNDMPEAGYLYSFGLGLFNWLNLAVLCLGLGLALRTFFRSRRCGWLVVAGYFAMALFSLLALPALQQTWHTRHPPDIALSAAKPPADVVMKATNQMVAGPGHPVVFQTKKVRFPLGSIVLVAGLWLLARPEPSRRNSDPESRSLD